MSGKSRSTWMGQARGNFLRYLRGMLLDDQTEEDALSVAILRLGDQCVYCGVSGKQVVLQGDHLHPQSQGGITRAGNIVPSCGPCNYERHNMPWQSFLRQKAGSPNSVPRTGAQIEAQLDRIERYIREFGKNAHDRLEEALSAEQWQIYRATKLILQALTDGLLAELGHNKPSEIKFSDARSLFSDLRTMVEGHRVGNRELLNRAHEMD